MNTVYLVLLTMLFAVPLGVAASLYLEEYGKKGRFFDFISASVDILSGIPSIIFGLFGMLVFVQSFSWGFSLISGVLTVTLLVLPTIIRTSGESIKNVSPSLREASLALGATRMETIFHVVIPSSAHGIMAGVVLAIGRTVGETAALMYTMGSSTDRADGLLSSARGLAMHIYLTITEGKSSDEAYASAFVLVLMVLAINTMARRLMGKGNGHE